MSTNEEFAEQEEVVIEQPTTKEEKFLGIKNTVISENKEESDFDVEIIDDRPEQDKKTPRSDEQKTSDQEDLETEIDNVDDRVKKRIGKLKYEWHEERRAKEAAEKLRDESVNFAKQQSEENRRLQALVQRGESALMTQVKAKAETQLEQAKQFHKNAYEAGDADQLTDATQEMLKAQSELKVADDHLAKQARQQQQQQNAPIQQQPLPTKAPPIDQKAVVWLKDNPWFGSDDQKEMTALAYGIHETLITKEGVSPQSDKYYEEVSKRMRVRFPDYFGMENSNEDSNVVAETVTSRNTQSVVAPSTRNNGSKPRKVQLTSTQVALARRLGLSPERYAKELIKERNNV